MNSFFLSDTFLSLKKELYLILLAFVVILFLPFAAVLMLTNAGIDIVSNQLVTKNVQTNSVEIHNPKDGSIVALVNKPMHWPIHGVVTLEFGTLNPPYQPIHTGIDIANDIDTPMTPFMDGTVLYAGQIFWGFGKHVIISHGDNIVSIYAHLDRIYVYPGEKVTMDQVIGAEGMTGWATGPHLHFQINVYGIPVNPRTFLQGDP